MALAVASTVVLIRVLSTADLLHSPQGHLAVGWLIVEDLFTVILLVLIPIWAKDADRDRLGRGPPQWVERRSGGPGLAVLKLTALVAILLLAVFRVVPRVMTHVARLRSP